MGDLRAISMGGLRSFFANVSAKLVAKSPCVRERRMFEFDVVPADRKIGLRRGVLDGDPYFVFDHDSILA